MAMVAVVSMEKVSPGDMPSAASSPLRVTSSCRAASSASICKGVIVRVVYRRVRVRASSGEAGFEVAAIEAIYPQGANANGR